MVAAVRSSFSRLGESESEASSGMAERVDDGVEDAVLDAVSAGSEDSVAEMSDSEPGMEGMSKPSPPGVGRTR